MRSPPREPARHCVPAVLAPQPGGGVTGVLIELQGAAVRYGAVAALSDVHLRISAGERVALVGGNGSGKSTLLRLLHGLLRPITGTVACAAPLRQAMVFQRPYMLRTSVQNNVALGLWLQGSPWREARHRALEGLRRVGMAEQAQRNARGLSGGQQQRVALARAWVRKPDLWLLDEPTASLDPHAKREVEALMAEFAQASPGHPMTMVFASHNLGQVKRLASRVIYLEHGRVLADLPVDYFFDATCLASVSGAAHLFVKGELA